MKEVKMERRLKSSFGNLLKTPSVWILGVIWIFATGAYGHLSGDPPFFHKELSFSDYANTIFGLSDRRRHFW
jgi:hypothetical protein